MDPATLKVRAPTRVLFVCGGRVGNGARSIKSLRDAFVKVKGRTPLDRYHVVLAEDAKPFAPEGYRDLLRFESDIAQISELVMLFSESAGSFAELGAFTMHDDLSRKLLVVIDDHYDQQESFIRLGPMKFLEERYGDASVYVIDRTGVGIGKTGGVSKLNLTEFHSRMVEALEDRLSAPLERTTFDPTRNGHLIKFMVGAIDHYGALELDEISSLFTKLGHPQSAETIKQFLLTAEAVGWVDKRRLGNRAFFSGRSAPGVINFGRRPGLAKLDLRRWRNDVVEHWKNHDRPRFRAIQAAAASAVGAAA